MAKRSALTVLAMLAASCVHAEEAAPPTTAKPPEQMHGLFSHGDSGDVMEDFFGGRVERTPPDTQTSSRKHDPAIRWDDRPGRR